MSQGALLDGHENRNIVATVSMQFIRLTSKLINHRHTGSGSLLFSRRDLCSRLQNGWSAIADKFEGAEYSHLANIEHSTTEVSQRIRRKTISHI